MTESQNSIGNIKGDEKMIRCPKLINWSSKKLSQDLINNEFDKYSIETFIETLNYKVKPPTIKKSVKKIKASLYKQTEKITVLDKSILENVNEF